MSRPRTTEVVEKGDIFFFYRPRVGVEEVKGLVHIQRLYMILARKEQGHRMFRVLVIGRKRMPESLPGVPDPDERSWAMVVLATPDLAEVRHELAAKRYVTGTRGEGVLAAAKPVGEGRYWLLVHDDHTELAHVLELPDKPSRAQSELRIKPEASYIVAVRNPDVAPTPGVPAPTLHATYPKRLRELFNERRWIRADSPELLEYEYAQLLLVGAHAGRSLEDELGIHIERKKEDANSAEVFNLLHLDRKNVPVEPLFEGMFPMSDLPAPDAELEMLPPDQAPVGRRARHR